MADRDQRIAELQEEYWDMQFEAPRPRGPEAIKRDEEQLADLGSDVGRRPGDFPIGPE